ncbi:hypothetical protein LJC61_06650 [Ruminococcaceae bacterium OttesenSCG-928-A16]|nr:hypothetical protein [Ruminococcaceae bacterium OttesenSCG-928-A16]
MAFTAPLKYKGKPLLRNKNEMYYGDMADPYVVFLQILSTKQENGEEVPDKISVMLLSTDTSLPPKDRIARQSMKNGLYNALDFAAIMLERSLADEKK